MPPFPGGNPFNDPVYRASEHMARRDFRACLRELDGAEETIRVLSMRMNCANSAGDRETLDQTCRTMRERYPRHVFNQTCRTLQRVGRR